MNLRFPNPLQNWIMGIAVFFMPFEQYQFISITCWILLSLWWLYNKGFYDLIPQLKKQPIVLLFSGFYLYHVIGMLWSVNLDYGLMDLQTKMSLFLIPLVFCTLSIDKDSYGIIRNGFIGGCIFALLTCINTATRNYQATGDISYFFYEKYSLNLHTTYFTMYLNLAGIMIAKEIVDVWTEKPAVQRIGYLLLLFFFLLNIMLISSKTATIVSFITVPGFLFLYGKKTLTTNSAILLPFLVLLFIGIVFPGILSLNDRYQQVKEVYNDKTTEAMQPTSGTTYNSTSSRLYLWKYSLNVISRNPVLGVGTGDLKEELNAEYSRNNWTYGIEKKYSSHNQYLHTGVILGAVGIVLLCLMLFLPFFGALKLKDLMYA